jgi:hypothetical protein
MKIIDKINEKLAKGERFFSYEFFPPRTEEVSAPSRRRPLPAQPREHGAGCGRTSCMMHA